MNKVLIIFLMLGMNSHDIQVAFFKISQVGDELNIEFVLEKEDVFTTFNQKNITLSDRSLHEYLKENFILSVNKNSKTLSFGKMQIRGEHIYLMGGLSKIKQSISSIEIENKCLLNMEDHSNIIEIRLNNQERDFLMNGDRTSIEINY